jgi:hypothetical protein
LAMRRSDLESNRNSLIYVDVTVTPGLNQVKHTEHSGRAERRL